MNIPELVTKLAAARDALGPEPHLPTPREYEAYRKQFDKIQSCFSALRNLPDDLAQENALLDDLVPQRAAYLTKEQALEAALAADPSEREQFNLSQQLKLLHDGVLYASPGVTFGSLKYWDERIHEVTRRRDHVKQALDANLRQAEQLLASATAGVPA